MPATLINHKTMRRQVRDALLDDITSGQRRIGERLSPIKLLARQFGTSFRTVQMALLDLERNGHVELRHGAGTFVADTRPPLSLDDAVAMCIESGAHILGDLSCQLTERLHRMGHMVTTVEAGHAGVADMMRRQARAGTNVFIVHGRWGSGFPAEDPVFDDKLVIGVVDWDDPGTLDRAAAVLVNHRLGGEQVARHLHAAGHRRVVLAGPESMIHRPGHHAEGFIATWEALGGRRDEIRIHYADGNTPELDITAAGAILNAPDAPTAVFGMRDYDICALAMTLTGAGIGLANGRELIGYGNTLWSMGGVGGFSSVDWQIGTIADRVCQLIEAAGMGMPHPRGTCEWVAPRLIERPRFRIVELES